jgi:NADH:ubiquinone oxidoreductase subunit C
LWLLPRKVHNGYPASTTTLDASAQLSASLVVRFPDSVSADARPGFSGIIIKKENLVEVATALRDEFGFDLLSSVTGVDYIAENKMEVVYHAHRTTGGPGLVFKVQADRVDPVEVPSLINIWAGADFGNAKLGIFWARSPDTPTCAAF